MRWLSKLFPSKTVSAFSLPTPKEPFYAIGDIHGCQRQLDQLLAMLDPAIPRVYVGDYIDRGDDSASVMRAVMAETGATALIGNHEAMMLAFIEKPDAKSARWLRFGGLQTLASYGVGGITESSNDAALRIGRDALVDALGSKVLHWLATLPASYTNGNITVVHAGANPAEPITLQSRNTLMWGHPDFENVRRTDGMWVLHGHTIVDTPYAKDGRIAIDTGAYATGRLTAALVAKDGVSFISTQKE